MKNTVAALFTAMDVLAYCLTRDMHQSNQTCADLRFGTRIWGSREREGERDTEETIFIPIVYKEFKKS